MVNKYKLGEGRVKFFKQKELPVKNKFNSSISVAIRLFNLIESQTRERDCVCVCVCACVCEREI